MTSLTHTPVTLTDHETIEPGLAKEAHVYSVTIFANELSRDGVSVDIDGMDFSNYRKNPVVLFAHDYSGRTGSSGLPIGRTLRLDRTQDGRISAEFEFLSGDPFADRVRNAWNRGFLRGASIGWRAIEARPSERARGVRIVKSELIEWSIVAVPADPDALRGAYTRVMKALIDDSAEAEIPSPLRERARACPVLDTGVRVTRPEPVEGRHPPIDSAGIDLTETRTLLDALVGAVREPPSPPDKRRTTNSANPEFCRDPPA